MQKLVVLFVLLIATSFVMSKSPEAATAIAALIEGFFVNRSLNFDFIIYRCPLVELVDEVSKLVKAPAQILRLDNIEEDLIIKQSAVLLFNESARFSEFYRKTTIINEFPKKIYLFVYIQHFKYYDLSQFHFNPWNLKEICNNIYFLLDQQDEKPISLVTLTVFQQPNCRSFQSVLVNYFTKTTRKWEGKKFTEEKFRNFNGCELVIAFSDFSWQLLDVIKAIESNLNFKSKIVLSNESTTHDYILRQNSMRMVDSFEFEAKTFKQYRQYTLTNYVYVHDVVFIVSRPAPYTFLEKALLPFDAEVWWWLIGFLAFGVMVIAVVSFMNKKIRDFVFGMKVKAPLLNMM
jgi:hypothetical protein